MVLFCRDSIKHRHYFGDQCRPVLRALPKTQRLIQGHLQTDDIVRCGKESLAAFVQVPKAFVRARPRSAATQHMRTWLETWAGRDGR